MEKPFSMQALCRYPAGTYADVINRNAVLFPDEEAFVYRSERVTFGRYNERVNSIVHALRDMGLDKGDVVGIVLRRHGIEDLPHQQEGRLGPHAAQNADGPAHRAHSAASLSSARDRRAS